jgi:hypothetical protein
MAMSLPGGSDKAKFVSVLNPRSVFFEVQYNPKEFQVNKQVNWAEPSNQGKDGEAFQYQKGSPMTATFDLLFDTTANNNENVQTAWVNGLLALTNPVEKPTKGEPAELDKLRPRALIFQWGNFSMPCVIESVRVAYLMFNSEGNAVRARCSVSLKEWKDPGAVDAFAAGTGGGRNGLQAVSLVTAVGGESLAQVAAAQGVDVRVLAAANGITDPLADCTGQTLRVPRTSAAVQANQNGGRASASIAGVGNASASWGRGGASGSFRRR